MSKSNVFVVLHVYKEPLTGNTVSGITKVFESEKNAKDFIKERRELSSTPEYDMVIAEFVETDWGCKDPNCYGCSNCEITEY